MASALVTGVFLGLIGLVTTAFFGLRGTDVYRHISYGVFSTLVTLFAHSMMMFYLIGKGKSVKDAMAEHHVTGDYDRRIAAARDRMLATLDNFALQVHLPEPAFGVEEERVADRDRFTVGEAGQDRDHA